MRRDPHHIWVAFLTAVAIVFVSAMMWLGIVSVIGIMLPWPMNVALLAIAVVAITLLLIN
jgi:hypothetical protein